MHGLIFKIKESHRQDQSESFVIYYKYIFFFTTSQMKSLHYDQCLLYILLYIYSLFHRDETKPTHIIGINSFLFLMQLIYKHSSPNYQHMISYWKLINKMLVYICVHKLKHFQPHSHLCQLWCIFYLQFIRFFIWFYIWSFQKLPKQLRLTFFSSYIIYFILLINCMKTVILAEQSLHHNIILEKQDHCWVSRICTKIVISESYTTSLFHI